MPLWAELAEPFKRFILWCQVLHIDVSKGNAKTIKVRLSVLHILIFAGLHTLAAAQAFGTVVNLHLTGPNLPYFCSSCTGRLKKHPAPSSQTCWSLKTNSHTHLFSSLSFLPSYSSTWDEAFLPNPWILEQIAAGYFWWASWTSRGSSPPCSQAASHGVQITDQEQWTPPVKAADIPRDHFFHVSSKHFPFLHWKDYKPHDQLDVKNNKLVDLLLPSKLLMSAFTERRYLWSWGPGPLVSIHMKFRSHSKSSRKKYLLSCWDLTGREGKQLIFSSLCMWCCWRHLSSEKTRD